uniref:ubiquitinyl hydrolase 1 n=1 Tax=Steinernema glaseri TaxID=37863 RepID=A0A1I8A7U2_9BILA
MSADSRFNQLRQFPRRYSQVQRKSRITSCHEEQSQPHRLLSLADLRVWSPGNVLRAILKSRQFCPNMVCGLIASCLGPPSTQIRPIDAFFIAPEALGTSEAIHGASSIDPLCLLKPAALFFELSYRWARTLLFHRMAARLSHRFTFSAPILVAAISCRESSNKRWHSMEICDPRDVMKLSDLLRFRLDLASVTNSARLRIPAIRDGMAVTNCFRRETGYSVGILTSLSPSSCRAVSSPVQSCDFVFSVCKPLCATMTHRHGSVKKTNGRQADGFDTNKHVDPFALLTDSVDVVRTALLKNDVIGYIIEEQAKSIQVHEIRVERGSLLEPLRGVSSGVRTELDYNYSGRHGPHFEYFRCIDLSNTNVYLAASKEEDVELLDPIQMSILKGVLDCEVRFDLFCDKDLFHFIYTLRVGDAVCVEIIDNHAAGRTKIVKGRVEFIGEPSPGRGTKYGVRLEKDEEGDMDGMLEGRRLFHAPPRGAVLVGAESLKRTNPPLLERFNDSSFYMTADADFDESPPSSYRTRQLWREAQPSSAGSYVTSNVRNVPITIIPTSNSVELSGPHGSSKTVSAKSPKNGKGPSPPSSKTNSLKKSIGNLIPGRRKSPTSRPSPVQRDYYVGNFHGIRPPSPCLSNSTQSSSSAHYDVPPPEEEHGTFYMAKNGKQILYPTKHSPTERAYDSPPSIPIPDTIVFEEPEKNVRGTIADETRRINDQVNGVREKERVVWFDGKGIKHVGVVKWMGRLEGYANIYLGVEFEDKCGGGSGRLRGEHVFDAKLDHAAFVPLPMCMLEKDLKAQMQLHAYEETYAKNGRMPPPSYASIMPPQFSTQLTVQAPPSYSAAVTQGYGKGLQNSVQKPRLVDKGTRVVTTAHSPPGVGRRSPPIVYRPLSEHSPSGDYADIADNSCVEVTHKGDVRYGVVAWIGESVEKATHRVQRIAIVILDSDPPLNWERVVDHLDEMPSMSPSTQAAIFKSSNLSAIVPIAALRTDSRFVSHSTSPNGSGSYAQGVKGAPSTDNYLVPNFGNVDSGVEKNPCGPAKDIAALVGRFKGIQGYCNSCYLDATLYAMFIQSTEFDYILDRPKQRGDIPEYEELLKILKTEIVYPLRKFHYVRADHVLKFRQLLSRVLPDMTGLTCDEKDPEEILNVMFGDLLKVKPMLRLRNMADGTSHESFLCPLIAEDMWSPEQLQLITLQYLIERSMYSSTVQFNELPKTLIVQLPRSGQQKLFDKIVPNVELDLTHLIYGGLRPCRTCSSPADVMCPECFLTNPLLLNEVTFCQRCFHKAHMDKDGHSPKLLEPCSARKGADRGPVKEHYLQLSAVTLCDSISQWLTPLGVQRLYETLRGEGRLPLEVHNDPMVNRLLTDCYICFYTLVGPSSPNSRRAGNTKFFA